MPGGRLLERDDERAALLAALDGAERGRGGVVIVEAAAGLGKSALLETAGALAAERGARVLAAHGGVLEQDVGWGSCANCSSRSWSGPTPSRACSTGRVARRARCSGCRAADGRDVPGRRGAAARACALPPAGAAGRARAGARVGRRRALGGRGVAALARVPRPAGAAALARGRRGAPVGRAVGARRAAGRARRGARRAAAGAGAVERGGGGRARRGGVLDAGRAAVRARVPRGDGRQSVPAR